MDCWIERSVGKAYYPWGERVNPNTLNLSRVIMEITVIPPSIALPSEIKISPETIVSMDIAGGILRPEEDARYYEICGYVSDAQQQDALSLLK